jgi:hypothetical protein
LFVRRRPATRNAPVRGGGNGAERATESEKKRGQNG